MGVYYVNDAGGKIGRFNIAGDTPTPEEAARIEGVLRERNAQYTQPVAPEPPKDNGWNLGTAFGAGVDTLQSGLYGATELAGHVTGIGGLEQWGKEGREANQAEIQKAQQNLVDFNNIKSTGDWAKYFAQSAAASIPSMAPQLAAAMIPGALPARIAYAVGAGSPQFIGNNVQAQHDQSGAITSPAGAIFGGVAQSALDSVLDLFLVGKAGVLLKEAAEKQGRNLFVRTIKNAATGAAIEAPTELGQQIIEDLQAGVPINFDDPAVVNKYKQVGITAAVLGSGFGALKGITSGGFPKVNEPGAMTPQATGVLDKEFGQYQQNLQASDQYYQPNQPVDQPMLALPPAEGMSTEVPFQQRMSMDGTATAQPIQIAEQAIQRYTGASAPAGQLPPTAQMQQPQQQNIPQVTPKPTATTGFPGSAYELRNLAYNSRPNLPQERLGPRGSDYMRNNPAPTKPEPPKPMEMKLPEAKGSFAPQEPEPAFERKFKQAVEKINQTGRVNLPEIRQIAGKGSFRSMVGSLVDRGVIVEERKGFYRPSNAIKSNLKRTGINTQETNVEGGETQLGIVPELPKEVDYDVQQLPVRKPGTKETGQYTIYKDGQPISKSFKSEQEAREVTNELGITGVEIRPNTTAGYTQGYKVKLPEGIKYNDRLFESKEDADNLAGTIKGAKVEEVRVGDNLGDQTPDSAFAVMERPKDVSGNVVPGQKVVSTYKTKEEAKDDIAARRGFTAPLGRDQAETPAPGDPRKDAKARERGLDSNIAVDRRQFLTKEDSYKAYKEKNAPVLKEAIAYLKKTAGKNAPKLRLVRKIEDDGGIIRGSYADKVIRVATDIYGIEPGDGKIKGVKNTITHELIHFFREAGFFTDKEWKALVNTANKAKFRDTDNTYRDVAASNYGKDDVDLLDEETVAMFAADWMETDQAPLNVKPLLRRMWDWLKSLFTGPDGEAILRSIKDGEFADRTPTKKESTREKQSKVRRYNPIQKAIDEFPQEKVTPDQWPATNAVNPVAINLQQAGVMDMIQKSLNKVMTPIYGPKVAAEKSVEFSRNFAQKMIDKRLPLIGTIEFMQRQGLTIDPESNPNVGLNLFSSGAQAEFETNVKNKFITQIAKDLSAAKVKDSDLDDIKKVNFVTQQYIDASRQEGIASEQALLDLYALAKHAPERNKWIRENRYTPEMIQELDNKMNEEYNKDPKSAEYKAALDGYIRAQFGSGVGDVEAQEILDWFDRYRSKKQIDDAWNNLRKIITEVTLPTRRKYKLGGDMYEDLKGQEKIPDYKNYVPLYGAIEAFDLADQEYMEISSVYGKTGAGLKIMGREDKRALGRKTLPFNIYGSVTSQALGSIVRGRKNEVLKDFYRVVKDITNDKKFSGQTVFEIMTHENGEPRAIMQRTVGADGKVKFVPNNMYKSRDEYVVFKDDNGRDIAIKVNDPLLARSLNSSADYDNNSGFGITDAFGRGTKVLARLVTTYNPVFILTNSARDAIYVRVMLNQFGVDGLNTAFEKELKTAWRHSREAAKFHFTGEGKVHTDYEKWKQLGGETNFYGRSSAEVRSAELKDIIPDPNPAIHKRALQGAKNMLMAVERVNSYIENYNRYALYRALVAKGVGEKQAALASKEITVNFERSGTWGDTLGNFYMFWKAAMNGTNGLAKAMVNSPRIRKAVVGIAAVGFMADMAGAAGEDDWDKIPDYVHKRNLVLPTFMSNIFGGDGTMYAKVPIPYGINFFYYSGILMSRAIRGKESPVDVTSKTLGHFLDTFSPWGNFADFTEGGNSLQAATPTLFDPLVENYFTNKDFSGRPIMPQQSPFGINAAPHATYFPNASEASKTISLLYNRMFNGDKYDPAPGEKFLAPDQIDHLVKSYSGGVGTLVMQFLELGLGITGGKPPGKETEIRDYPMLNAWFGSVGARTNMANFGEKRDQVLAARAAIKDAMASGDPEAVQASINKYKPMLPIMGAVNDLNNKYRTITQTIRKIEANTRMDDTYKRNTLEYLYDRRRAVVDAANRLFNVHNI